MRTIRHGWKVANALPRLPLVGDGMGAVWKLVRLLGGLCLAVAVACWFQYGGIQMSWAGRRPLTPNAATGEIIPFENHGTMYVSQADLDFLHYFIVPGLAFGAIGLLVVILDRIVVKPEARISSGPNMKTLGTIAEVAFIAFMPIWLFANPFTALANTFGDARQLLYVNIGIGAFIVAWFWLMDHGAIFRKLRGPEGRQQ